jgi:WD40 repeat protein
MRDAAASQPREGAGLHPDGARLVSGGDLGGELLVWDLSTGRIQGGVPSAKSVQSVVVSPDGARIAALSKCILPLTESGGTTVSSRVGLIAV